MTDKAKVLDKLGKLVAARDGEAAIGNEAAAEAFAAAVNRLLLEHDLSMSDVEHRASLKDDDVVHVDADLARYGIDPKRTRVAWQEQLAAIVADAHMCAVLVSPRTNRLTFVGTRSHASVAEYAYGTLAAATEAMSWKAYNKEFYGLKNRGEDVRLARGYRAAWLAAFIRRIASRFEEVKRAAANEAATVDPREALARIDRSKEKVKDALAGAKKASAIKLPNAPNARGWRDGRAAADAVELGRKGVEQ